ncbi:MAG: hypothetical protein V1874_02790 [Spirochaetota bacterium]
MKTVTIFSIAVMYLATTAIISCSSDSRSDSHTPLVGSFGDSLRTSLPEVEAAKKKLSPTEAHYQSYDTEKEYGGMFQRVLGDDPLSIFFMVDIMDQVCGEILYAENPDMTIGEGQTLTLPFFGDSIAFTNTFKYNGTHTTSIEISYNDQSETKTVTIDDFRGGYTDLSITIFCHLNIPEISGETMTLIYYAEKETGNNILTVKYADFATEFHEDGEFYSTNMHNVSFMKNTSTDPYTYKSAVKDIRTDNGDTGVFSIIMGGVIDEFLIRRRAHYNDGADMFIDQLFATTYDASTNHIAEDPLEEQSSTNLFDIDGAGFTGGGLGDTITLVDPDATHLQVYADRIAAHNMIDFSETTDLPQSEAEVTPEDWNF